MKQPEAQNGEHEESTENSAEDFWEEIHRQFHPMHRVEHPTFVLSPAQIRRYQLAYLKVPKFQHLLVHPDPNYKFCIVEKSLFQRYFHEFISMGLLDTKTLEPRYKSTLPPAFQRPYESWEGLLEELTELIKQRDISERFAKLWSLYLKRNHIMLFFEHFDPYAVARKSAESNDSSEVERYIYALWMHFHGYQGKKGERTFLITRLAHKLDEVVNSDKAKGNRPWRFTHYDALLLTKGAKNPLIRTVTDMNPEMIAEYATDGAFAAEDFPELFSAT